MTSTSSVELRRRTHLVLRHDSVRGRDQIIHSNVTQIDLHDFSRLCLTYDLGGFHCVTEMEAQHRICGEILDYWRQGAGKEYNPDRVQALTSLKLHHSFDQLIEEMRRQYPGQEPLVVGTSAIPSKNSLDFERYPTIMERSGRPALIVFGTAWGLSPAQINRCDWVLPPINGHDGYNHLSVRCAAAIIVDRLF